MKNYAFKIGFFALIYYCGTQMAWVFPDKEFFWGFFTGLLVFLSFMVVDFVLLKEKS
ncbi:hypothetical protein M2277_005008 [Paenibacillus sp. LBL]|uniref:hypothetical protein n=1 Tax=Paenibacillus sp. LBL TaxID=2940563 RepID=UPI002476CB2F|nr:hypothetical protein [Paenibacillus sp. LBL]MDH6674316.1 hypothetical protein [Paenibacillus sp. LBL]